MLESTKRFHKIRSEKVLKRIHKKALKIASSRLKAKNLITEKHIHSTTKHQPNKVFLDVRFLK
jgi:hypothetical protein